MSPVPLGVVLVGIVEDMMYSVRALGALDLPQVLTLNNEAVPAVNELDADALAALVASAAHSVVVTSTADPATVLGFVIGFAPRAEYASENYRWFGARSNDFLYVDRIVVAPTARSGGLGQVLYGSVFEAARKAQAAEVFCEVNTFPPNPRSLAFHSRLGFTTIGEQSTKGDTVVVALLAAPV
ncbi:GNAT family N-acetyltransferase [Cryobacterium sp. CG_9.6]|uniref:GNAT family N-acetyltransferase n=1 Tax=Cryobacterium sp. CG_9.6 TaxID=2760710 RepID=UPI002473FBA8|nr:GNAT family N-acetyltransferase [Cryobacterium sp. CG_9.6]MDH6237578.1 putative GNAT superfamily acetyltransferase [Cryobacterium sp. CG_9.6]